jgi:hypothetical protein
MSATNVCRGSRGHGSNVICTRDQRQSDRLLGRGRTTTSRGAWHRIDEDPISRQPPTITNIFASECHSFAQFHREGCDIDLN